MSRLSTALARVLAVIALAAVALALFLVISSSLEDGGDDKPREKPRAERQGERNNRGDRQGERTGPPRFYIVQPGDSLSLIEEETGVSIERLQELNPDIDPQILQSGARLRLR